MTSQTLEKLASSLVCRKTTRFAVLELARRKSVTSDADISIHRYTATYRPEEALLRAIRGRDLEWERRWYRRHQCYVALAQGSGAGYLWVAFDGWRLAESGRAFSLPPRSAFIYDAVTAPRWRGRNIYPALLQAAAEDLARDGYAEVYLLADDGNAAAQRAPLKVGFEFTGRTVTTWRLLRRIRLRRADRLV